MYYLTVKKVAKMPLFLIFTLNLMFFYKINYNFAVFYKNSKLNFT